MEYFKITIDNQIYTVIPDEEKKGLFLVLADDITYQWIQMIEFGQWVELNPATHERVADGNDERIKLIGKKIERYFD